MSDCPECRRQKMARYFDRIMKPLLEPHGPGLPGGTMTMEEIARHERNSPIKGEPVTEESWPSELPETQTSGKK
ncbi:hypothetical protein NW768_009604 [Fusarium equiseti]|uniref:Uncharacterized protein n=1 Tax=Fusarium equiseti TaxID=61235 RepID=A0ABQ8R2L3_FUSEQ|nr:hypothetical protein NW768_009604 [Fusarium equiseti]